MSTVLRRNRKGSDQEITRLNSLGLSLAAIGQKLHCHPTSITLRLKSLKIRPADTRRAFMEDIYTGLPGHAMDTIADMLENRTISIKDYVKELIHADLDKRNHNSLDTISSSSAVLAII